MGNNLFQVLFATIKAKFTPIVTKIKLWTSSNFIKTRVISKIRDFFTKSLDVKPRHKKDYYQFFGWLVSKRLAVAIVLVIGVLSIIYLVSLKSTYINGLFSSADGIRTYAYNSVFLRFADATVRITGKSGYLAYEGQVSDGAVNGTGTLYNPEGNTVYTGAFKDNMFEGHGTSFFENGSTRYVGDFSANVFQGEGKLFRSNGSLEYVGDFVNGKKEGSGYLYDSGSNQVFVGDFSQDDIVYSEFLGKTTSDIAKVYTGARTLYENEDTFAVVLSDIDAMYVGRTDTNNLNDSIMAESVYVMKPSFVYGDRTCTNIQQVREVLGEQDFDGNSEVLMSEALAINYMNQFSKTMFGDVDMERTEVYDDYITVENYDDSYEVYLYSFRKDSIIYTFICQGPDGNFEFYCIEKEG